MPNRQKGQIIMNYCKLWIVILAVSCYSASLSAGDTIRYTLASCREMALSNGATSRSSQEALKAAEYNRKAALAAMFPRVTANGA